MISMWKPITIALTVFAVFASSASVADAQWYQTYYAPPAYQTYYAPSYQTYYAPSYQTNYAPAYQTYYAPSAYQTNYAPAAPVVYSSGWYPGYWLDRTRAALFGRRAAYVASYPATYSAGYSASYAPAVSGCSTCTNYSAGYAPCSTCGVQQVSLQPACSSCSSCSSCSDCGVATVSQTGYVTSPGCSNCTTSQPMTVSEPTPVANSPSPYEGATSRPSIPSNSTVPSVRSQQKPEVNESNGGPAGANTPGPTQDELDKLLDDEQKKQETFFEAPKLFNANDKAVQWSPAPVRTAVYHRPAGQPRDRVMTQPITWEKAKRDAVGWASASK